jgi:RNA polymerase sigma factor (sigma-70 family)
MTIVLYCQSTGDARFTCAREGCSVCMETLLQENRGLVWVMVTRQFPGKADYADLLQEGRIGLWRAILYFDPKRGVTFGTYASAAIRYQVWAAVRRSLKAEGWLNEKRLGDSLEALLQIWQQEQIHQALEEELDILPKRLSQVIELHYGLSGVAPQNFAEIGREWGLCRDMIRQLHNQALSLLRLPALSIRLRSICERQDRANYRQAISQNQAWQRKRRGWR